MRRTLHTILLLSVVCFLISCSLQPSTLSCETLASIVLQKPNSKEGTLEYFPAWVEKTYSIDKDKLLTGKYDPIAVPLTSAIGWEKGNVKYNGDFIGDNLAHINVEWQSSNLTSEEVVNCLGNPSNYIAIYGQGVEQYELGFYLLYPEQGVVFLSGLTSSSQTPPSNLKTTEVYRVRLVDNGNAKSVLERAFIEFPQERKERLLINLQAWPDTWQKVNIKIEDN